MKSIPEFLSYLRSLDIHLWAEEERLRYNAPKGILTQELREQLRARKTEILAFAPGECFCSCLYAAD